MLLNVTFTYHKLRVDTVKLAGYLLLLQLEENIKLYDFNNHIKWNITMRLKVRDLY